MQDNLSLLRMSQRYADSGRLVLWEHIGSWGRIFLNQLRQTKSQYPINTAQLSEQAIFVSSSDDLRRFLENHPESFVFAEVTFDHYRELLVQITFLRRSMFQLRLTVVCFELSERTVDEYNIFDLLFREAGATAVLSSQRDLSAMIPVVVTHFSNLPPKEIGWRESIEQRLPWRSHTAE